MACLFVLECLARLPLAQISLHATTQLPRLRAQRALQFALDHSATSCRLLEGPQNCPDDAGRLTLGRVHSREEHLQVCMSPARTPRFLSTGLLTSQMCRNPQISFKLVRCSQFCKFLHSPTLRMATGTLC